MLTATIDLVKDQAVTRGGRYWLEIQFEAPAPHGPDEDTAGTPIDLTGYDGDASITDALTGAEVGIWEVDFFDPANGWVRFSLTSDQATAIPIGAYRWRFRWRPPGGDWEIPVKGKIGFEN